MTNAQFYLEDLKSKFRKINTNEYYLSYSGGKDSHLLYWFIKEYAPEFKDIKVVGINTYTEIFIFFNARLHCWSCIIYER